MPSGFAGFRFPPEVSLLVVGWYLRFGLSHRDLEEPLTGRGVEVDRARLYRWVQRYAVVDRRSAVSGDEGPVRCRIGALHG